MLLCRASKLKREKCNKTLLDFPLKPFFFVVVFFDYFVSLVMQV